MSERDRRNSTTAAALAWWRSTRMWSVRRPRKHQEAVERSGHGAHRVLQEPQAFRDRVVRRDRHAEHHVRVAGEVLGRGVEHDVGAHRQRALDRRRRERVVDHDQRPSSAFRRPTIDRPGDLADIDGLEQWIGRRFEPDEPGALRQRLPQRVHPRRQVDERRGHVPSRPADLLEIAIGAAVHVVADDDLLARIGKLGDGGGRR